MTEFDPHELAEEVAKEVEYRFIGMRRKPDDRDWAEAIERTLSRIDTPAAYKVHGLEDENYGLRALIGKIEDAVGNRKGEVFDKIRALIQRG